jgi:hypothetical protein
MMGQEMFWMVSKRLKQARPHMQVWQHLHCATGGLATTPTSG